MIMSTETYDPIHCAALQREEREVLESIHPDCLSADASKGSFKLEIPVDLPEPFKIIIKHPIGQPSQPSGSRGAQTIRLTTLPSILIDVCLPPTYPYTPPQIRSIHATHSWLAPEQIGLHDRLIAQWVPGEGVLYTWVEWFRSGEFLEEVDMVTDADGQRTICISHPAPSMLLPILEKYDSSTQAARFSQNSFECEVCLTSIKGARCVMLACSHVFCRSCLEDFWGLCIKEGDVGRVGCPDPGCVKEHREASEEEVRRVVTEDEVLRWKWLRMKRALEKDPTLVHCPMALCQTPVPRAQNVDEGSPWERFRMCPDCGYSFCAYCKRTWHGPVAHCPISATKVILQEYMALPEGSLERKRMEGRYGRSTLQQLAEEYENERAFQEWLERSTGTPCPGCELRVEKHSGCNHMTCIKCNTHYCYRCGTKLDRQQPYKHFSTPGLRCFSKLFDLESIDDDWQPVEGFEVI